MIYKHMYIGYAKGNELFFKDDERIITSSGAVFDDMAFVYYEARDEAVSKR